LTISSTINLQSRTHSVPPSQIAQWLTYAGLAWGAFAFGAVYPWAYWPLALVCAASGIAGLYARGGLHPPAEGRGLLAALAAVAAAALLQLVPLPVGLVGAFSPHRLELLNQLDVRFALGLVNVHGLSLDGAATIRAVFLYAGLGLFMLGLAGALTERSALRLLWVITWLGIALAVTGIVQRPLYTDSIYGFWKPLTNSRPFGPFVNKNHFAGWMVMAIPLVLGYFCAIVSRGTRTVRPTLRDWVIWLSSREANQAMLAVFAVMLMGLALVLSLSRSGMISLVVALLLCSSFAVRRQQGALGRSAIVGGLALLSVIIVVWAGTETIAARFAVADTIDLGGRLPIWGGTVRILEDFWLTGSGLNTFGVATLFYPAVVSGYHLGEAHNDYLQLAVEGGLLLGIPILVAIVTFALTVRRRFMASEDSAYWIRLGAVAGLVGVAVQSVAEFSLQIPGNAALFATLCAVALHRDHAT
jgi:O-antigen ligase